MDYQKETFFNTEALMMKSGNARTVKSSLPGGKRVGGIRFRLGAPTVINADIRFSDLTGAYTPYIDGVPVSEKRAPFYSATFKMSAGEHVFDIVSDGLHKGAAFSVSGAGVLNGESYLTHEGGAYNGSREIVFVRPGKRKIQKFEHAEGGTTASEMNAAHLDAAFYYDKARSLYTEDLVMLSAQTDSAVNVITGEDAEIIQTDGLKDLALADGLSLPSGADFLAAIVNGSGVMRLYAFSLGGTPALCLGTFEGVERVKSAGRGSTFLFSDREGVWKAMRFWSEGNSSLVCGNIYMPYDVVNVTRNKIYAPTCNVRASADYPFYYYKLPSGLLVMKNSAGQETAVSYADAFIPGAVAGFSISENDVSYQS